MEGQSMNETTGQELQRQSRKQVRRLQEANDRLKQEVQDLIEAGQALEEQRNTCVEKAAAREKELLEQIDAMQAELDRSQPMAD